MARKNDFAYYEADAMMQLINPFTDIYVDNPTTATFKSKPLKVWAHLSSVDCLLG